MWVFQMAFRPSLSYLTVPAGRSSGLSGPERSSKERKYIYFTFKEPELICYFPRKAVRRLGRNINFGYIFKLGLPCVFDLFHEF